MAILNNVEHGELRYRPLHGDAFGDAANRMQLFPDEFAEAQKHHPIVFGPDAEGRLAALALLGFDKGENLHFREGNWGGSYVPAIQRRGPFSVSVRTTDADEEADMLVDVDLGDPRIGTEGGELLFKPHGGSSAALDAISDALVTVYSGAQELPAFLAALLDLDLLREVQIEIDLGNGQIISIPDHLVIDEGRFASLEGGELKALNDAAYLVPVVHAMSSIANIQTLVDRKVSLAFDGN